MKGPSESGPAHGSRIWRPIPLAPLADEPLVSVLLTNYNYARFLDEAIRSVIAQTYRRFELIAVDDGSTDGSAEIIRSWEARDPRVHALIRPNQGQVSSINAGAEGSAGEVVCLLDSDDVFLPTKLEAVLAEFRRGPVGFVHHMMRKIGPDGSAGSMMPRFGRLDQGVVAPRALRQGGRWRRAVSSGISFRREVLDAALPIPVYPTGSADGYLCMVAPFIARIGAIEAALALYRIHGRNLAGRSDLEAARFRMHHIRDNVAATNLRLTRFGIDRRIEVERSLSYHEQRLLVSALGGAGYGDTMRRFRRFLNALSHDPVFTSGEKLALVSLYSVMMAVPAGARETWLRAARQRSIVTALRSGGRRGGRSALGYPALPDPARRHR
jgi:glycosyltransferase involved in cell wall biosynthesis